MTELEIKVKDGRLYFSKSINQLYPDTDRLVLWFRKVNYSKLLKDIGLSVQEAKSLLPHSNEIVSVKTRKEFFTLLKKDIPEIFKEDEHKKHKIERSIRIICADSRSYDFTQSYVKAPEAFSNIFCAGSFVLIVSQDGKSAEIWDSDVWQNIKAYLIENKKARKKDFEKFKVSAPKAEQPNQKKTQTEDENKEDLAKLLEKHGL